MKKKMILAALTAAALMFSSVTVSADVPDWLKTFFGAEETEEGTEAEEGDGENVLIGDAGQTAEDNDAFNLKVVRPGEEEEDMSSDDNPEVTFVTPDDEDAFGITVVSGEDKSDDDSFTVTSPAGTGDTDAFYDEVVNGKVRSYLTGKLVPEEFGRTRPMALMIENDKNALEWQRGTSNADIIYEARVEGGITRLEAIFEDYKDVPMIMPVRSCRPQFVYYAREYQAHYGHYGQVIYAVPILQMWDSHDIAGLPYGEDGQEYRLIDGSSAYRRDHEGVTGICTNYDMIQQFLTATGYETEYTEDYKGHFRFAGDDEEIYLKNGKSATTVETGFSNSATFYYDEDEEIYLREEFGMPQVDHLNDEQLAFKNIIIEIGPSTMLDDRYVFTDPVNEGRFGEGYYITNGRVIPIRWRKEGWRRADPILTTVTSVYYEFDVRECDFNVTRYYDMTGQEITLNQGKTFVEIIREEDASGVDIY